MIPLSHTHYSKSASQQVSQSTPSGASYLAPDPFQAEPPRIGHHVGLPRTKERTSGFVIESDWGDFGSAQGIMGNALTFTPTPKAPMFHYAILLDRS